MNRIVITGAEVVSPIGNNLIEFYNGLIDGTKGISNINGIDTSHFPTNLGAEVKQDEVGVKIAPHLDRKVVFLQDSVINLFKNYAWLKDISPEKKYFNLGAGLDYINLAYYAADGDRQRDESIKHTVNTSDEVKLISEEYNINGGNSVFVTACVASSQAVGQAYRSLKNSNDGRTIIAGGFESMLNHAQYMGFYKLGALSSWNGNPEDACRPFDKDRCGLVLGEGAALLILQTEVDADKSQVLAEICGYSSTMDSYMVTDPLPDGAMLAKAAIEAIKQAGINPDEIDSVHLHGTGTRKNAISEAKTMEMVFGERFTDIPVFSLKGQVGHLIAACGAMEIVSAIYSIQNQLVLPTINFETPDEAAPLKVIKDKPKSCDIRYILKLNSAFGGQNTAIVLKKYE